MKRSGAVMTWQWLHNSPVPGLLRLVQDRDLWQYRFPGTREIHAFLMSHDFDFARWSGFSEHVQDSAHAYMLSEGAAILRAQDRQLADLLKGRREMQIGPHRVWVANLPPGMASDGGNQLAGETFGACYHDEGEHRVFSLRSRPEGLNVAKIAALYGGGGHAHAAGFRVPLGWEGES